jgi:hypothetical protein
MTSIDVPALSRLTGPVPSASFGVILNTIGWYMKRTKLAPVLHADGTSSQQSIKDLIASGKIFFDITDVAHEVAMKQLFTNCEVEYSVTVFHKDLNDGTTVETQRFLSTNVPLKKETRRSTVAVPSGSSFPPLVSTGKVYLPPVLMYKDANPSPVAASTTEDLQAIRDFFAVPNITASSSTSIRSEKNLTENSQKKKSVVPSKQNMFAALQTE